MQRECSYQWEYLSLSHWLCLCLTCSISSYRFMVMDRFGTDLQKTFEENGKRFPRKVVLQLGLKLVSLGMVTHG